MRFSDIAKLSICASATTVVGLAQPWRSNDILFVRRAETATFTQTVTKTETETVTESPVCMPTENALDNPIPSAVDTDTTVVDSLSSTINHTARRAGSCYAVPGVGTFTTKKVYEFDKDTLPSDLAISSYLVYERKAGNPWNHGFVESNVNVRNGFLNLVVPGHQNPAADSRKAIYGGEVYTVEQNILYASVRTGVIFDDEPGTCQGIFSYQSDTAEIDIEYLSNSSSTANPSPDRPPVLWYTNQPGGTSSSQKTGGAPSDATSAIHEYRIDWIPGQTRFYIDGVLQKTLTRNVPAVGSQWVWNNWANGNADWSTGPPVNDNVFRIDSITMYYNTTAGGSC